MALIKNPDFNLERDLEAVSNLADRQLALIFRIIERGEITGDRHRLLERVNQAILDCQDAIGSIISEVEKNESEKIHSGKS